MNLVMVERDGGINVPIKQVMVRLPKEDAQALDDEARNKGTTLAAYCREILLDHLKGRENKEELLPIVREIVQDLLKSDDLDEEFGKKVAKSLSKRYQ